MIDCTVKSTIKSCQGEFAVGKALLGPPEKLRIPAEGPVDYVGRLEDGTQYMAFVTGAYPNDYVPNHTEYEAWRKVKRWIGVIHLFDADGNYLHSHTALGGFDIKGKNEACDKAWAEVHRMFTPYRAKNPDQGDIHVRLFSVVFDGVTHGLVYEEFPPYEEGLPACEYVHLEPRDLHFEPPWDSGQWSS
jgi:hypothetical protein